MCHGQLRGIIVPDASLSGLHNGCFTQNQNESKHRPTKLGNCHECLLGTLRWWGLDIFITSTKEDM